MKILKKNFDKNYVKLQVESLDDLWTLTYIIEENDIVKAKTLRKIKLGEDKERSAKIITKNIYLTIKVEKVELHEYSNRLRINGKIIEGPEYISTGRYHTINIEEDSIFELKKQKFLKYQIKKLKEAIETTDTNILICVHDREEEIFAILKKYGYEILTSLKGNVAKKAEVNIRTENFYSQIKKVITTYDKRYKFDNIIIASPSFWRKILYKKFNNEEIKKKLILASCSNVGENGINEVIKREEVKEVLKKKRFSEEIKIVEKLLEEISKENPATYGIEEVKKATQAGAVDKLLITDKFIQEKRQKNNFTEIEKLMRKVEQMNGDIHIINSSHEGGRKLDGLGGIAALLRYKINY